MDIDTAWREALAENANREWRKLDAILSSPEATSEQVESQMEVVAATTVAARDAH